MVKNPPTKAENMGSFPGLGRSPGRRKWQLIPVFLPGKLHGRRSLVGCSPWGCKESNTTEHTARDDLVFSKRDSQTICIKITWDISLKWRVLVSTASRMHQELQVEGSEKLQL